MTLSLYLARATFLNTYLTLTVFHSLATAQSHDKNGIHNAGRSDFRQKEGMSMFNASFREILSLHPLNRR